MDCPSPRFVWPKNRIIPVGCGKCLACLSNKRTDWIIRLEQEFKASKGALFITLTYHPKYLPKSGKLCKPHFQKYMKRLRKKGDRLRYFAVGEYGSKNGRPHYHVLLFNTDQLNEAQIKRAWTHPKTREALGIVHIGAVTAKSIAYCTKYIVQQKKEEQFTLMSRAYGLGLAYITDRIAEWHREDDRTYILAPGGIRRRLPRYYRDKIFYREEVRQRISDGLKLRREEKQRKEVEYLKSVGIKDVEAYQAEQRNAVLKRVRKKVAYTQTL